MCPLYPPFLPLEAGSGAEGTQSLLLPCPVPRSSEVPHTTVIVLLPLLRASGRQRPRRAERDLVASCLEAIEISSPLLEQCRHRLDIRVPRHGLTANVDPDRMAQVISAERFQPNIALLDEGLRV